MPVVYPNFVGPEANSVRNRIQKKYDEYMTQHDAGTANSAQLKGERYEIVVAVELYKKNLFTAPRQISRWNALGEAAQNISLGENTDYDFILPSNKSIPRIQALVEKGPVLGEAKSYSDGLGTYIKKAVGYCINDPTLGGFCFVTPMNDYELFLQMTQETIAILAGKQGTPAITGGDAWHHKSSADRLGKPAGPDILKHFKDQYYQHPTHSSLTAQNHLEVLQNQHASDETRYVRYRTHPFTHQPVADYYKNRSTKRATAIHFNSELAEKAGFVVACYQVKSKTHDELIQLMSNLV